MIKNGFARDIDEAVLALRDKYGDGRLVIYPAHTQPRWSKGFTWFEFYIEGRGGGNGKDKEAIIKKAVNEGINAGRREAEKKPLNAYKETERRLYALPDIIEKVKRDTAYLEDLQTHGLPRRSADIIRFKKSGVRVSDDEIIDALIQDMQARIAADEYEIQVMEEAMAPLKDDPYFLAVSGRYFDRMSDEEIAAKIPCAERTVRRNRGILVRRIAVRLYGAGAL